MYIPYPQFEYRLSLFYLNSCLLSHLRPTPSNSVFLRLYSEIQDRIYCGHSIKAETKVRLNSDHHRPSPTITNITGQHRQHRSSPTSPIQIRSPFGHDLNIPTNTNFRSFFCSSKWRVGDWGSCSHHYGIEFYLRAVHCWYQLAATWA